MIEYKDYITYNENDIPKDVLERAIKYENIERNVNVFIRTDLQEASFTSNIVLSSFIPDNYLIYKKIRETVKPSLFQPITNIIKQNIENNSNYIEKIKIDILNILK